MSSGSLTDSLRETLDVFEGSSTPRTTTEVAERLDLGRRSTYARLDRLVDRGHLETKKVGASGRVWWRPAPDPPAAALTAITDVGDDKRAVVVDEVLDRAQVGVFVLDPDFQVAWLNDAVERYFGLDREAAVGQDKRRLVRERIRHVVDDSTAFAETVLTSYEDDTTTEPFECRVLPGEEREERWLEHRSTPIESGPYAGGRVEVYYDVTDRKMTEARLEAAHERLQSLVQAVDEYAIFMLDPDGRVQTWNDGARRIKGYRRDEVLGEHVSTFYTDDDREAGTPEANLAEAETNGVTEIEGWRVRKDGSKFWAHVTITAIRDDDGSIQGYAKVTRDLTDRREHERELRTERNLLERILETSPVGIAILNTDRTIVRANDRAEHLLGLTRSEIEGRTYDEPQWNIWHENGDPVDSKDHPVSHVLETGDPVLGFTHGITLPDGRDRWLSSNAAPVFDGSGDVERVVVALEDITRLKKQARRLERQRDELKAELDEVFQRVREGVMGLDTELRLTYVNERAADLLERSAGTLLGEHLWDAFDPGPEAQAVFERALETQESVSFEEYNEPLDTWFESYVYPSETGLSIYFRDVTDRKERERRLERYETIVETVRDGVYAVDQDARFVMVNDAFCDMTGWDREELLGQHASTVHDDRITPRAERLVTGVIENEHEEATIEREIQTKSGERVPAESRIRPFPVDDGYGRCGIVRDVTERKQFEEALTALYDSARELFRAETKAAVSDVVVATVTDVLDLPGVVTYLYDEAADHLYSATESLESGFMGEDQATVPLDGSSITARVYSTGESRRFDDVTESPYLGSETAEMRGGMFAPMGDHGILVVGSRVKGAFDERIQRLIELLAANAEAALDRVERERELEESEQRYRTLVENFPNGAVALFDEDLRYLLAGGEAYEGMELSLADLEGETLSEQLPSAIHEALEPRYSAAFDGESSEFEVEFDGQVRQFRVVPVTDETGTVFAGMAMSQDVTQQRAHERELERQREQLTALNNLNGIVRNITEAVIDQSTREEIEDIVCERLAGSDSYLFAWIGDVDVQTQTVNLRTEAGVEGYLDGVTISTDPDDERSRGPTGRAIQEREIQVTQDVRGESAHDPWREHVREYGFRSSAAIPIVHEDTLYGVLNVYAARPYAFTDDEQAVISQLGEVVGHAIAAVEQRRALMSEEVIELEFQIQNVFEAVGLSTSNEGTIALDRAVPIGGGVFLQYGSATDGGMNAVRAAVESGSLPSWESVSVLETDGAETRFELRLTEPPIISTIADHGGYVDDARIEDGTHYLRVHLAPRANVSRVVDVLTDAYPEIELMFQRQVSRSDSFPSRLRGTFLQELTDRQRSAIEAAYHAGYFAWPRESTGEKVADSLGVSPPTFHQHLRKAENKLLSALLENHSATG